MSKTIFFEEKYNVDISDFSSTEEIDAFVENHIGRKLEVIRIDTNLI